jgi:hypothetical protein
MRIAGLKSDSWLEDCQVDTLSSWINTRYDLERQYYYHVALDGWISLNACDDHHGNCLFYRACRQPLSQILIHTA